MRRLPWVTLLLATAAVLNPVGIEILRNAFWSSEQLSRNIAQPIVFSAAGILIVLGILEMLVKYWLRR